MLDHGAGTGLTTQLLLRSLPDIDVVAVDPNPDLLSALTTTVSCQRLVGTAECLTEKHGVFDLVVSNLVLPFCSDAVVDLRQMLSRTTPGGSIVATTLGEASEVTPFHRYWTAVATVVPDAWLPERYAHHRFGDSEVLASTFESAGWRVESIVKVRAARRINARNAWIWLSSVLPTGIGEQYRALTDDEREAVRDVFLRRWSEESRWRSAGWTVTARAATP